MENGQQGYIGIFKDGFDVAVETLGPNETLKMFDNPDIYTLEEAVRNCIIDSAVKLSKVNNIYVYRAYEALTKVHHSDQPNLEEYAEAVEEAIGYLGQVLE